jgi:hypothetical protein
VAHLAAEAQPEGQAETATQQPPAAAEAYPSLPPPDIAEAVIQAAQAPEPQPAVEQGD